MRLPHSCLAGVVVLAVLQVAGTPTRLHGRSACPMTEADVRWVQRALDGWDLVRREFLKLEDGPLPWIVLFDAACTWHLAPEVRLLAPASPVDTPLVHGGRPVEVRAQAHDGTVLLPNRIEIPASVKASTALYRSGRAPFFSMSLPALWRQDASHAKRPQLDEYLQGVMVHELTHTRLLVAVNRRVRDLIRDSDLAGGLNDDAIQREFARAAGFERAFERERDLFYHAVQEADPARRATVASRALALVKERHARYFTGANSIYREIESLFLTLEGTGQWAAWRLATARARPGAPDTGALRLVRDNRKYWSQDEGLALFILIDALMQGWQARVFSAAPPSPFEMLEEAILAQRAGPRK